MRIPTTPLARRIAALVKRRPTTPWSEQERKEYGKLFRAGCFNNLADLELLEQYYAFQQGQFKRGKDGFHRRDLLTLLRHFPGEIDKATDWREQHPLKQAPRKIIPLPPLPSNEPMPLFTEDELEGIQKFQQQFAAFKTVRKAMGKI